MAITVTCSCGKTLQLGDQWAGKCGKCPSCGQVVMGPNLVPQTDAFGNLDLGSFGNSPQPMQAVAPMAAPGPYGYAQPAAHATDSSNRIVLIACGVAGFVVIALVAAILLSSSSRSPEGAAQAPPPRNTEPAKPATETNQPQAKIETTQGAPAWTPSPDLANQLGPDTPLFPGTTAMIRLPNGYQSMSGRLMVPPSLKKLNAINLLGSARYAQTAPEPELLQYVY